MWKITLCPAVALIVLGIASCYVPCPDGKVCSQTATCCTGNQGDHCCPYPKGRCCRDGYHCCPYGYDCDPSSKKCLRQGVTPSSSALISPPKGERLSQETPLAEGSGDEAGVVHCDSNFYCKQGTSCCKGRKGHWKCCPDKVKAPPEEFPRRRSFHRLHGGRHIIL